MRAARQDLIEKPVRFHPPLRNLMHDDIRSQYCSQYRHIYCYIITYSFGICKRSRKKIYGLA